MKSDTITIMKHKWDAFHKEERTRTKYPNEEVVRFIFTQLPRNSAERRKLKILDLGCGTGTNTVFLSAEGFRVYATDISEEGIKITKKRLKDNKLKAVAKIAAMEKQPFPDNFFDAVISYGVLYHNDREGYRRSVAEMRRVLKRGGKAFIYTKSTDDYTFGKGRKIGENTFILDVEDTGEKGMMQHFLDKDGVDRVFNDFSAVSLVKTEAVSYDPKRKRSAWIINVKK